MPVLVVQTGHVGRPPAPWSVGTAGEQEFTRRAGGACERLLNRDGWSVRVINADPGYPNPDTIGGDKRYYYGDAFVAVHCDGSSNPDRDGASFGYYEGGRGFAGDLKAAYCRRTGRPASWCEPDNYTSNLSDYYGTRIAVSVGNTRAVIMECGFLTNPQDRDMLLAPTGPDNVALAIGDALGMQLEDTVTAAENADATWRYPINGVYTGTLLQQVWDGINVLRAGLTDAPTTRAQLAGILAAVTSETLDSDAVLERVDAAVREATTAAVGDVVLPALRTVLAEALGDDNTAQAELILDRLRERLAA